MKQLFLLSLLTMLIACSETSEIDLTSMQIIAHRGGALLGNENTLSCFQKGIEAGADYIELDVHMTKDRHIVVCHDQDIDRTTDSEGRIEHITLSQFKAAHALDAVSGEVTEETLPTLQEALLLAKGHCKVLLEIKRKHKGQYPGIEADCIKLINQLGMHEDVVIQSFDDDVLENVYAADPTMRIEKLIVCRLLGLWCITENGIERFSWERYHDKHFSSINSMGALTTKGFVKSCHEHGFEVKIWTVNDPERVIPGVDGVISNRPDLF